MSCTRNWPHNPRISLSRKGQGEKEPVRVSYIKVDKLNNLVPRNPNIFANEQVSIVFPDSTTGQNNYFEMYASES